MPICFKTGVCDWVGSTNRERWGVARADTTYVDLSAVGVHNETSDDICTYSLTRGLLYHTPAETYIAS